jgi:hypothetical protein
MTAAEFVRQLDGLLFYERQIAIWRLKGKNPVVWQTRQQYERERLVEAIHKLTGE